LLTSLMCCWSEALSHSMLRSPQSTTSISAGLKICFHHPNHRNYSTRICVKSSSVNFNRPVGPALFRPGAHMIEARCAHVLYLQHACQSALPIPRTSELKTRCELARSSSAA
jgi:hypothetical protein